MTRTHARNRRRAPAAAAVCVMVACSAFTSLGRAHHALPAHYEPDRVISITGVVEEFRYANPHAVIYLRVPADQGEADLWTVEWAGSGALRRRGVLPQTLSPGDRVTLYGHPARNGSLGIALQRVQFADGRPEIGPPDRSGGAQPE